MALTITTAMVTQFSANLRLLAEQKYSVLRDTLPHDTVVGEAATFEIMNGTNTRRVTERYGDTPYGTDIVHTRRWVFPATHEVPADLIDKPDKVKLLIDPGSAYTVRHASAMGRAFDTEILDAFGRSVVEGASGTTTTPLPNSSKIVSSSTGQTLQKLMAAKQALDEAEIESEDRYWVMRAKQFTDLLSIDQVTNKDYTTVQALVQGSIDTYMGFTFKRCERVPLVSGDYLTYAYHRNAGVFCTWMEPNTRADEIPLKRYVWQLYTMGIFAALRIEDARVQQVACV